MLETIEGVDMSRALPLDGWTQKEWNTYDGKIIVRRSQFVHSIVDNGETLLVVGVHKAAVTAVPELWVVLCRGFNHKLRRNVKYIRSIFGRLLVEYPRLEARVDKTYEAGMHFARFMGFKEIDEFPVGFAVFEVRNDN